MKCVNQRENDTGQLHSLRAVDPLLAFTLMARSLFAITHINTEECGEQMDSRGELRGSERVLLKAMNITDIFEQETWLALEPPSTRHITTGSSF